MSPRPRSTCGRERPVGLVVGPGRLGGGCCGIRPPCSSGGSTGMVARGHGVRPGRVGRGGARVIRSAGLRRRVTLLLSDRAVMLMTWGWVRPFVLLPAEAEGWGHGRWLDVLSHEFARPTVRLPDPDDRNWRVPCTGSTRWRGWRRHG
ncbi:MAG: hypothetical protein WKF75_20075 [Singulisphaera sp.]